MCEQVDQLDPHPIISQERARRRTQGVHTKSLPNFPPIPPKAGAYVTARHYGLGVSITASTSPSGLFSHPNFLLLQKEFDAKMKPFLDHLEREHQSIIRFAKALNSPQNRYEMKIYRKAYNGQAPSLAIIIKQLTSRFSFLEITQSTTESIFAKHRNHKKLSTLLHLFGLTPCAPNLPLR